MRRKRGRRTLTRANHRLHHIDLVAIVPSTSAPMSTSMFATKTPCTMVRAKRHCHSLLVRMCSFRFLRPVVKGHNVVLGHSHVLPELVGALSQVVVLLTFSVRESGFSSITARDLELERITPTRVTTPVMQATIADSMRLPSANSLLRSEHRARSQSHMRHRLCSRQVPCRAGRIDAHVLISAPRARIGRSVPTSTL